MRLTTHYFSVTRGGPANVLTDLLADVQPASPEIVSFQDIPASKGY